MGDGIRIFQLTELEVFGTHYVGPGQVWTYTNGRLRRAGGRR